jgi:hypothetical protein
MRKRILSTLLSSTLVAACAGANGAADYQKGEDLDGDGKADASAEATILDMEFDGELVTDSSWSPSQTVRDQLLYTIGHLNGDRAVGRLDRLELTSVKSEAAGGKTRITYHVKMPVAWGSKTDLPTSYSFRLPRDVSYAGQDAFTAKYKSGCVDFGAHDVSSGSMWYYYRPNASGCALADADIVKTDAVVTVSTVNTTGKYPEYHKVWEDGALNVVAIFGKYEDGATTTSDAGIAGYNAFVSAVKTALPSATTVPAMVPSSPGASTPDITFTADLPGGRKVQIVALLVDNIGSTSAAFDARYEDLSARADVIVYNGHAGLGQNVRALARKGHWLAGQYVIVFMNGCDTFAYVDGSLAQTRAAVNPDDPTGTKYMEFVVNGMPAYFSNMPGASMALIKSLMNVDKPSTYEQIFRKVSATQIVLVTGEQDNVFVPGMPIGGGTMPPPPPPPDTWTGLDASGAVARAEEQRWQTPTLAEGTYEFTISGDGDADLYVRLGQAPTTSSFDCRPYRSGSEESCVVTVGTPAPVHVMVRGYASGSSKFTLTGRKQ